MQVSRSWSSSSNCWYWTFLLHQVIYYSFNQRNKNSRSSKLMTTNCNYRTVQNLAVLAIAAAAKVVRSPTLEKKFFTRSMSSCTHCYESSEDRSGLLTDKYKEGIDHGSMMLPSRKNPETHPGISICVTMDFTTLQRVCRILFGILAAGIICATI